MSLPSSLASLANFTGCVEGGLCDGLDSWNSWTWTIRRPQCSRVLDFWKPLSKLIPCPVQGANPSRCRDVQWRPWFDHDHHSSVSTDSSDAEICWMKPFSSRCPKVSAKVSAKVTNVTKSGCGCIKPCALQWCCRWRSENSHFSHVSTLHHA